MLFDDDPRDMRKKRFIEECRRRRARELLSPLSEKILAWEQDEIDSGEVFSAAEHAARRGKALVADFRKRPEVILAGIAMDENRYITGIGGIGVEVRLADIMDVFSDAIVSPVEGDGSMAKGVAPAIRERGGGEIEDEAKAGAPVGPGKALSTGPGSLTTGNVIHVSLYDGSGSITPASVAASAGAALAEAESLEAETVVMPGLGFFEGGIGPEESAAALVEAIGSHAGESVGKVLLVDLDEKMVDAFVSELEKIDGE